MTAKPSPSTRPLATSQSEVYGSTPALYPYLRPSIELQHLVHRDLPEPQVLVELAAPGVGSGDLERDPIGVPLLGPRPDALQEGVPHAAVAVPGFDEHVVHGGPRLREEGGGALAEFAGDEADRAAPCHGHEEEGIAAVGHVGQEAPHGLLGGGRGPVDSIVERVLFGAPHPEPRRLGRVRLAPGPYGEVVAHGQILTHAPRSASVGWVMIRKTQRGAGHGA